MKPKSFPSRLFDRNSAGVSGERRNSCAAKYQRHVDSVDQPPSDDSSPNEKAKKDLNFAFLPERYEPLIDDEAKEEKKKRKKENYKKVKKPVSPFLSRMCETMEFLGRFVVMLQSGRKRASLPAANVGKALRTTWKCLMLGLYNFALAYSTPIAAAATFVPDFHPSRDRT